MELLHNQFNLLVQLVSRSIFQNLSELLLVNKINFTKLFCAPKSTTQFEISLCLDNLGKLTSSPTPTEHRELFQKVFLQMEDTIFKNYFLTNYFQDLVQMFFWQDKRTNPPGALLIRRQLLEIEQLIRGHAEYLSLDIQIEN